VTAFIAAAWWPNNPGHVLIIPNEHFENIFDLPPALAADIQVVARAVALGFKAAYGCAGVSTRQHNEPAGNQDVWHYHLHLFPRYAGDELYLTFRERRFTTPEERLPYATRLRAFFRERA
jgi:histidine triad (HIT) family protein